MMMYWFLSIVCVDIFRVKRGVTLGYIARFASNEIRR